MIDVIFSKRTPSPRERDTRPVPSEYRPKQLRAVGAPDNDYYGDEPAGGLMDSGINLHKLEGELTRNRLNEIATLVRSLTYGEMMELARAIWQIRPEGAVDKESLPMMLHLWSTALPDGVDSKAEGNTAEQ
jgi:hypothetical protein